MQKLGGQAELIPENLPELQDEEVADKLEKIWKLRPMAKEHDKLMREVKEVIQGWVLGLPKADQNAGQMKCGDFVLPFSVEKKEAEHVEYDTKGGKKVKLKFAPQSEKEEE